MSKKFLRLARLVPLALLFAAGIASAQTAASANGVITGVVSDASSGKPVAGVVVVATSPTLKGEATAVTDGEGKFTLSGLPAGSFRLSAQLGGYKTAERADLVVKADTTLRANLAVIPDAVQMEEVVVTGSRVRRLDLTAPAPVMVVNREELVESGRVSVGDFLQMIPQQVGGMNAQVNNGGDGAFRIDLRGLGSNRTLVLLNGRRMVPGGTGADGTVDLNAIPFAAVDRVEVMGDGASAVYGTDAIAGVVNVITRKGYAGTGAMVQHGFDMNGGTKSWDVNVNTGVSGDTGSVFFNVGYFNQEELFAGARDWATTATSYDYTTPVEEGGGPYPLGSGTIPNGRFAIPRDYVAGTSPFIDQLISTFSNVGPGRGSLLWQPAGTPGTVCTTHNGNQSCWRPYRGSDSYNYQPVNYLVTPMQRVSLFTAGDAKLGSGYAPRLFFEGLYTNRYSKQLIAAVPLPADAYGLVVSRDNYYNPTGIDIFVARKRFVELGGRASEQDIDTFRAVVGLDGKLPAFSDQAKNWVWDTSVNFGRTVGLNTRTGSLVLSKLASAFGPSFRGEDGNLYCGTPGNTIAGCQPINMFGGPAGNSPQNLAAISFDGTSRGWNQMLDWQVNFSGELYRIPTANRPISLAIGNDLWKQWGGYIPNPIAAAFDSTEDNGLPTKGEFWTEQAYAELAIPLVSDVIMVNDLEATAAVRYSWYNTFGSNFSYQFGGKYRPIAQVAIRGTYGTGYRAPTIGELYAGQAESFPAVTDPCAGTDAPATCGAYAGNGDVSTQLASIVGGNANLKPETSKNWTVGAVWTPSFLKGLSFTVDYWSYDVTNAIGTVGAATILNNCYYGSGQYCSQIIRNPVTGYVHRIIDTLQNVGRDQTAGIDGSIRFNYPSPVGRFEFGFDATWLNYFDRTYADGETLHAAGNYDLSSGITPGGVYPKFKFNANLGYTWQDLFAGLRTRFIGGFKECGNADGDSDGGQCFKNPNADQYFRNVPAYNVWDVFASYTVKSDIGRTTFGFGINNLFNVKPAVIYSAFAAMADPAQSDYIGRYFLIRLGHNI